MSIFQSEATSVHQRSIFNRFPIKQFLQYSPYPVIDRIKVRTVRRPCRSGVMKTGVSRRSNCFTFHVVVCY